MLCYLGWLLRVDGCWRRIVRPAVLVSFVDVWDCFLFLFRCLPFLLLTLQLQMKTTSSLSMAAMKLEIKTVSGSLTVTPCANYVFRVLSLGVVLSRLRHFGDIIAASLQTLLMYSSQASDSKLRVCRPPA